MIHDHQENQEFAHHDSNALSILSGLLVGGLAGAITVLLIAPQSGETTRRQIMEKGHELREQVNDLAEDAISQIRLDTNKVGVLGRRKARKLLKQSQALVAEQLDHVAEAAQAGKKAIQNL